ncbi:MAG: hypothetical protein AB7S26_11515 [Sandaracinaceae bacterium]
MAARYHRMLMALPMVERLKKGCAMFDAAKAMILASLRAELGPDADPRELRRRLALRLYGDELGAEAVDRFLAASR